MAKRQHPHTVHFNVQYIKYLFYIQVWEIYNVGINIVVYIVFVYGLCRL